MKYYRIFDRLAHKTSKVLVYFGAAILFLMMTLTVADVVGRFAFNSPIKGTKDLIELGLVLSTFAALAYIALQRQLMRADVVNAVLSKRNASRLSFVTHLLALPIVIIMAWQTCKEGISVLVEGISVTATIFVPVGPFLLFAGLGLALLALATALDVVRYIEEIRGRYREDDDRGVEL
jgi:TRAP-type C4-dicarboxylate transport system permease small subunit